MRGCSCVKHRIKVYRMFAKLTSEIRRDRQVGIRQRSGPLECVFILL